MSVTDDRDLHALEEICGLVSRETYDKLKRFEAEFRRWNARINLAAPSTIPTLWTRHILDSAQLAPLHPGSSRWLDIGSGGGFPGAIMAILLADRSGHVDLVESNNKKSAFLRQILNDVGAPARVHTLRIEDAVGEVPQPQIVTARALAPLTRLLSLSKPWLVTGATGLFHKGRDYRAEVEESRRTWNFDLVVYPSKIDPDSAILAISNVSPRDRTGS